MFSFPLVESVTLFWNVLLFSKWSLIVNVKQFVYVLSKRKMFLVTVLGRKRKSRFQTESNFQTVMLVSLKESACILF